MPEFLHDSEYNFPFFLDQLLWRYASPLYTQRKHNKKERKKHDRNRRNIKLDIKHFGTMVPRFNKPMYSLPFISNLTSDLTFPVTLNLKKWPHDWHVAARTPLSVRAFTGVWLKKHQIIMFTFLFETCFVSRWILRWNCRWYVMHLPYPQFEWAECYGTVRLSVDFRSCDIMVIHWAIIHDRHAKM